MSLEELEASMIQGGGGFNANDMGHLVGSLKSIQNSHQKSEEESSAFKRLVSVCRTRNVCMVNMFDMNECKCQFKCSFRVFFIIHS